MDLRRLRAGEWIAALSGAALVASLFLPWYEHAGGRSTGWQAFSAIDVGLAVVGAAALALWLATVTQPTVAVPVATAALVTLAALVATVVVAIRLIDVPELRSGTEPGWGAWAGLAAAAAAAVGGWVAMHDERLSRAGRSTDLTGRPVPPAPGIEPLPPPPSRGSGG